MNKPWFWLPTNLYKDPKMQDMPPDIFRVWFQLMCLATEEQPPGSLPDNEDLLTELDLSPFALGEAIGYLTAVGLIYQDAANREMVGHFGGDEPPSADTATAE